MVDTYIEAMNWLAVMTVSVMLGIGAEQPGAVPVVQIQQVPQGTSSATRQTTNVRPRDPAPASPIPLATIEACRGAALGNSPPAGIDCAEIARQLQAENRQTAEGTLLTLFGQQSNVTQPRPVRSTNGSDANAVARDIANGATQGDAAAIAAQQRGGAPPSGGPR